jgi:hypothetical protein
VILLAPAEKLFASVRRTASKTLIPSTAVYCHLVGRLGMTMKPLCLVPRGLSPQQKGSRVQKAQELLALFKSAEHNSWKNIITLDESFFYMYTDFE